MFNPKFNWKNMYISNKESKAFFSVDNLCIPVKSLRSLRFLNVFENGLKKIKKLKRTAFIKKEMHVTL